jgi:hypothetical protein
VGTRPVRLGWVFSALVALLLVAIALGAFWSALPHHELPDDFDFHGQDITEARREAVQKFQAQLAAVERRIGIDHVGPTGRIDWCDPGHDNFERSDQYAYSCTIELVELIPVRDPARAEASRLGEALIDGDCPNGTTTDMALAEQLRLEDLPETGGDCTVGSQLVAPRISGWLRANPTRAELSDVAYRLPSPCALHEEPELCEEMQLQLAAAVAAAPRGTAYLAIVNAGGGYHNVDW